MRLSLYYTSMKNLPLICLLFCTKVAISAPKNMIFIIVDGMGPSAITASRIYAKRANGSLFIESFPHTAYSKTYSSTDFVTDSAASATALAAGVKTANYTIGVTDKNIDSKGPQELQTITDIFKKNGKKVGVITNTHVTHATPAAFYAHALNRKFENQIATQVKNSSLDLLLGGGQKFFTKQVRSNLKKNNWNIANTKNELTKQKKLPVLGIFNQGHLNFEADKNKSITKIEPSLSEMVTWAITKLKNPKGFFLAIESGRVDYAAHFNHALRFLEEMIEMDKMVELAKKLAGPDTLIVITADHDTASLAINGYAPLQKVHKKELLKNIPPNIYNEKRSYLSWSSGPGGNSDSLAPTNKQSIDFQHRAAHTSRLGAHTAVDVPILATGPGSELFHGYINNHLIPHLILKAFDFKFTSKKNIKYLKQLQKKGIL